MCQQDRCLSVAGLTLAPDDSTFEIRCDLSTDHIESHAMLHDDVVLITWGIDDSGNGVILGGVLRPLFPDAI